MRRDVALAVALAVALGGACSRPPEERPPATPARHDVAPPPPPPPPRAWSAPVATVYAPQPAERCIRALPAEAPPAPPSGVDPRCPPDDVHTPPRLPTLTVTFPDAQASVRVELVRTVAERARGLMFRKAMLEDRGMLFRMDERSPHDFWMRNTCISLDMLFVDDDGVIVGIYENAPTLTDDERGVGCASSWVLETNAGWSRRHGVLPGQRLVIPDDARR